MEDEIILYKNGEYADLVAFSKTIHIELGNLTSRLKSKVSRYVLTKEYTAQLAAIRANAGYL